jgi:hypothetical protein
MRLFLGFTLLLLFAAFDGIAQTYEFTYDASGNRIKRQVIVLTKKAIIPHDTLKLKLDENLVRLDDARIYPNPTKGLLQIELPASIVNDAILLLYDSNGKMIVQQTAVEAKNELNLLQFPTGTYILSIRVGQSGRKEWKIIKE